MTVGKRLAARISLALVVTGLAFLILAALPGPVREVSEEVTLAGREIQRHGARCLVLTERERSRADILDAG